MNGKKSFFEKQRQVLAALAADKQTLVKNQAKRALEDDKLKNLKKTSEDRTIQIEKLNKSIAEKQSMLANREKDKAKL